jgi:hypothetical protein
MPGGSKRNRWESAVAALLTEPSVEAAAAAAGISYRTLKAWLTLPEFRRLYQDARRRVVDDAVAGVQKLCARAVEALGRNLECDRPAVEIRAAVAVLNETYRGMELLDLESELAALRAKLEGIHGGPKVYDASRGGPAA